jgi:TIR domain
VTKTDDVFTVFISHKHDDHALALEVKKALQGLAGPKPIDCFVSGTDITVGMDWRREIRSVLARSHVLVLLFTAPSKDWDWCLYETGLYCRFEKADKNQVSGVVCLFSPGQASPSPLADLQGVPAEIDKVRDFLNLLCHQTWKISDDWRQGALAPDIDPKQVDDAARAIERAFRLSVSTSTHFPCHRVVLSLSESDKIANGIPESARVMEGPKDTSDYTLSLFNLGSGTGKRTWGDLLQAVQGTDAEWRKELDRHFLLALKEQLFWPIKGRMRFNRRRNIPPLIPLAGGSRRNDRGPRIAAIMHHVAHFFTSGWRSRVGDGSERRHGRGQAVGLARGNTGAQTASLEVRSPCCACCRTGRSPRPPMTT